MLFLVGVQPKVGRLVRVPFSRYPREVERVEGAPEAAPAFVRVAAQIDVLLLGEDGWQLGGGEPRRLQGEDRLAFHPRQGDLGEAPVRAQICIRAERDHHTARAQLAIERPLPALAADDPLLGIEVEEDRRVVPFGEPPRDLLGQVVVARAVADEDRAHRPRWLTDPAPSRLSPITMDRDGAREAFGRVTVPEQISQGVEFPRIAPRIERVRFRSPYATPFSHAFASMLR